MLEPRIVHADGERLLDDDQRANASAKQQSLPKVYCSRRARAVLGRMRSVDKVRTLQLEQVTADATQDTSPAVLVLEARDLHGEERALLLETARRCLPSRPIIFGGSENREMVLEAINEWHAFRLLPATAPIDAILEAVRCAHELLILQLSVREYATDLLAICRRLAATLNELEATRERLMHAERLTSLGATIGALTRRMHEQSARLEAFHIAAAEMQRSARSSEALTSRVPELLVHLSDAQGSFDAMVTDMLALAARRTSTFELEIGSLDDLVSGTVRLFHYDPLGAKRQIHVSCDSGTTVRMDRNRLRHALLNLLRNAAQATKPTDHIHVHVRGDSAFAEIMVEDSGTGMSPETLDRLGTAFFTTRGTSGMGLGLRLARAVVENHGGTLEWESTLGKGSAFRIRLPVAR